MPLWDFRKESNYTAVGANTKAQLQTGFVPSIIAQPGSGAGRAEKRNVIITSAGWVRRENRASVHGGTRKIEQTLIAANPGKPNMDYASNNYTWKPNVIDMYVKLNANGYISANVSTANLYVVFDTPITFRASGNLCNINVANTAGGNHAVAKFANTVIQGRIVNANNTLVFRLPKLQGRAGVGLLVATYRVNAQSISVTGGGNPLYNPDKGITMNANLVITGAVSNSVSRGDGTIVTTFQVRKNG